jgi:tRNA nucleotidyltransferase (CCA-adding enzyme)
LQNPTVAHARTAGSARDEAHALCARLKVPNECRDLAVLAEREMDALLGANVNHANDLNHANHAEAAVCLFERADAFRKPQRFIELLDTAQCMLRALAATQAPFAAGVLLRRALEAVQTVRAGEIARQVSRGDADDAQRIAQGVHAARVEAVQGLPMVPMVRRDTQ